MKRTTILAWALCLFCISLATLGMFFWLREQGDTLVLSELPSRLGWGWAIPVVFSITSAVIIARQPGNRVGWLLMLAALAGAPEAAKELFFAEPRTALTPGLWPLLWLDTWAWIPLIFSIILIPLHFPSGRLPSPRWRWVNWLAITMWIFFILFVAFGDEIGPINHEWRLSNPIGFVSADSFEEGALGPVWMAGLLVITIGSVASLIVRYRRAGLIEKEQIKWLLYAAAIFGIVYAIAVIVNLGREEWGAGFWLDLFLVLSILGLPVAITIAIMRYRLFDIDVIIRKTAVYVIMTGVLALVYFGSVILLQALFGVLMGQQSTLILVISTLLIALLFSPLRRWLQGAIDRRFYRQKYNDQRVLTRFAQTARDETNLDNLTAELVTVLQETLQPQTITLWTAPRANREPEPQISAD